MLSRLKSAVKVALSCTPAGKLVNHRWAYAFTPRQLCFLTTCIDRTAAVRGAVVEIGCFRGYTSIWLKKHMDFEGIQKPYFALDTFSGFVSEQLRHELRSRGKGRFVSLMKDAFVDNSQWIFDRQLGWNNLTGVRSIRTDAATFDYATIGTISFALIDVDLYIPVKASLEKIEPLMTTGGVIVVDDCVSGGMYDGALQAYQEFVDQRGRPRKIVHGKLGVVEF